MGANIRKGTYLFDMFGVVGFAFWRLQTVLFQFDDHFMADLVPVSTVGFPSPLFFLFFLFPSPVWHFCNVFVLCSSSLSLWGSLWCWIGGVLLIHSFSGMCILTPGIQAQSSGYWKRPRWSDSVCVALPPRAVTTWVNKWPGFEQRNNRPGLSGLGFSALLRHREGLWWAMDFEEQVPGQKRSSKASRRVSLG